MKRKAFIAAVVVLAALLAYFALPGFLKNTTAYIGEYTVSADGSEITLTIGTASSAGYIRAVAARREGAESSCWIAMARLAASTAAFARKKNSPCRSARIRQSLESAGARAAMRTFSIRTQTASGSASGERNTERTFRPPRPVVFCAHGALKKKTACNRIRFGYNETRGGRLFCAPP